MGGCAVTNPELVVDGVVIAANGPSAAEVDTFTLRVAGGTTMDFHILKLDLTNGGLPSAHLREHMASGEPISVQYHVDNGTNVADRYTDAGPAASSTPTAAPTSTQSPPPATTCCTSTPSLSPTATPTSVPSPTAILPFHLAVEPFADGFQALTFLTNAGDGTGNLYLLEQRGIVWRLAADGTSAAPFLDLTDRVSCCGERGLLGLAFHPDFANIPRLFVDYTDSNGNTVVSEFGLGPDGNADPASERKLIGINQPFPNHNGGMLAFGPDGFLYIGSGDGGNAGDPLGNGQRLDTMLAKILRINIDKGDPYAIPQGNPFPVGNHQGALPEIWDWGVRNPWRFSFDSQAGDLWIGDVGQDRYEEVDAEPAGDGGHNYGWNTMEALHCYLVANCDQTGLTLPVVEYPHGVSCSITGGYVYRGSAYPALVGQYVFSDYCSGNLWAVDAASTLASGSAQAVQYGGTNVRPTSFGEDEAGELYLVNSNGEIYRLVAN